MYYKGMSLRVVSAWCMSANPRPVGAERHRSYRLRRFSCLTLACHRHGAASETERRQAGDGATNPSPVDA